MYLYSDEYNNDITCGNQDIANHKGLTPRSD